MAKAKITITLPDSQLTEIRRRVRAAEAPSVSGLIQRTIQRSLQND